MKSKLLRDLTIGELESFNVWEFENDHESKEGHNETWVYPIKQLPVDSLSNRVIITKVRLANGNLLSGMVGNIELKNLRLTKQFLTLSIEKVEFGLI